MENKAFENEDGQSRVVNESHSGSEFPPSNAADKWSCSRFVKDNILMILTLLAVIVGFGIGFGLREVNLSSAAKTWIGMPGYIFLNLTKMCIVPLIVSSVISSVATLDPKENGKVGGIQLAFLVLTNLLGATIGTILASLIKPGNTVDGEQEEGVLESSLKSNDIFADLIRNIFPDNIVRCTVEKVQTYYRESKVMNESLPNGSFVARVVEGDTYLDYTDGVNVLGLMFLSLMFGLATSGAGDKGKPFLDFFQSAIDVVLVMLGWFMWFAPFGILSLMIVAISGIEDIKTTFSQLGMFVVVVVVGLIIHQFIFLPIILLVATRENPFRILLHGMKAWLVSFAFTSMAVAMPYIYKMQTIPSLRWDRRLSNFGIPMAVALSKDGSALFIAAACLFLAQLEGIAFSIGNICIVWILVGASSLAIPSVPSASIVSVIIICSAVGIPTTNIGLLFAVEWLLDRLRTTSNLTSNIMSISFTNHFFLRGLKREDADEEPIEIKL